MITELEIARFKSIKHLKQELKRVNVFVGEPNTGKSNLLEALGLVSFCQFSQYGSSLNDFVRVQKTTDLFYDYFIDMPLSVKLGDISLKVEFRNGRFAGQMHNKTELVSTMGGDYQRMLAASHDPSLSKKPLVKFYRFAIFPNFPRIESEYLLPPDGKNLASLLLTNRELRQLASEIFGRYGLKMALKPQDSSIEIIKQMQDILISYPYLLVSDTLQRVIFHISAILSSQDSILVFEEPEAHAFPYYTKYLAELIALDERNNQYLIATHNPYFLEPLVEKTPKEDLNVFITYFEDYQTKLKPLSQTDMEEVMRVDIFSELDRYLKPS